jgi:hypothetical protein
VLPRVQICGKVFGQYLRELRHRSHRIGPPQDPVLVNEGLPPPQSQEFWMGRLEAVWITDIERHEALSNRAVVRGHRLRPVVAGR